MIFLSPVLILNPGFRRDEGGRGRDNREKNRDRSPSPLPRALKGQGPSRSNADDPERIGAWIKKTPAHHPQKPTKNEAYFLPELTWSFSCLPARNLGSLEGLMLMVSPVRGLRPLEAARFAT